MINKLLKWPFFVGKVKIKTKNCVTSRNSLTYLNINEQHYSDMNSLKVEQTMLLKLTRKYLWRYMHLKFFDVLHTFYANKRGV